MTIASLTRRIRLTRPSRELPLPVSTCSAQASSFLDGWAFTVVATLLLLLGKSLSVEPPFDYFRDSCVSPPLSRAVVLPCLLSEWRPRRLHIRALALHRAQRPRRPVSRAHSRSEYRPSGPRPPRRSVGAMPEHGEPMRRVGEVRSHTRRADAHRAHTLRLLPLSFASLSLSH